MTSLVTLLIYFTALADLYLQPVGEGIYHRCSYTVQTAGYLVSSTAELTTGMKDRKYNFYCRDSCLVIDTYGNSSSIIYNSDGIVLIDGYVNGITESCQCLIYRIVYDLIYQMMQSSAGCGTNVHSRTLSYSLQTFQYLNLIRTVFMFYGGIVHIFFAHDSSHSALQAAKIILICRRFFRFQTHIFIYTGNGSGGYPEYPVDLKPVIHKLFQTGTGNDRLNISDTV